ncbi:ATP-binding protein [Cytophaga sp. FL35]|uniref:ATP-binding protein n=1 Tax=Cytophaga sp. FL35 TaxID=1904456 RepID=UPI0016535300|nr:ATP-binding protein [Cytophaga sp. FL35]MBC7000732.1 GAF domain-containing protein [Cytophaga sp. FL35]
MKFKDIVNRDIVNLENCEDEAIHIPGLIQPQGFLLSINNKSKIVNVCSENIGSFLGIDYKSILGQEIDKFFKFNILGHLNELNQGSPGQKITFSEECFGSSFAFTIHESGDNIVFEGEKSLVGPDKEAGLYNSSKKLLSYIEDTNNLKDLCNSVAIAIKDITDYDRVMIYKFDKEYNGEVYAESKENHLEPFLGLHYPHTDIPRQARELYTKNLLRIIGDVKYQPVKLYTYAESKLETLNLSLSVLRSVSPIHLQYLENMGVGATLTVSLIHKGKLWGLIACHHYSPKYLSQEVRNSVKLHGHFITSQIDVRILNEQYEVSGQVNKHVDSLVSHDLAFDRSSIKKMFQHDSIYRLSNSDGVAALIGGDFYFRGLVPERHIVERYSEVLKENSDYPHMVAISDMPRIYNQKSEDFTMFPGALFHVLDSENYIIWFRVPTVQTITWAGDPKKSIEKDKNGLSPRKSFESYVQNVKDTSKPWLIPEINAAQKFKVFLQNLVRSIITNEDKERQRILSEHLKAVNTELDNISWISTHDLQEPLRKIRMMASVLLENKEKYNVSEILVNRIGRMAKSAERMQTLVKNILQYNQTNTALEKFEEINSYNLMLEVQEEIKDNLLDHEATLHIDKKLPKIYGIPFLLRQCLLNVINNSLKFKNNKRDVVIEIFNDLEDEKSDLYSVIALKDNGIGFDKEHNEKIFKIFGRLHSVSEYEGTGIGLAFCKKIMLKHNGLIRAEGIKDVGATIRLYFPKTK